MKNDTGVTLTADKVMVAPIVLEEKTRGGIVIPKPARDREDMSSTQGMLITMGPIAREMHELAGIEVGEIVIFSKFSGSMYTAANGMVYRIMKGADVLGKTENVYSDRFIVRVATPDDFKPKVAVEPVAA